MEVGVALAQDVGPGLGWFTELCMLQFRSIWSFWVIFQPQLVMPVHHRSKVGYMFVPDQIYPTSSTTLFSTLTKSKWLIEKFVEGWHQLQNHMAKVCLQVIFSKQLIQMSTGVQLGFFFLCIGDRTEEILKNCPFYPTNSIKIYPTCDTVLPYFGSDFTI